MNHLINLCIIKPNAKHSIRFNDFINQTAKTRAHTPAMNVRALHNIKYHSEYEMKLHEIVNISHILSIWFSINIIWMPHLQIVRM